MRTILAILTLLAAVVPAATEPNIEAAKQAVADKLRDPESARFSDVRIVKNVVCGRVNAKNRFGGYDGVKPWVVLANGMAMIENGEPVTGDPLESLPSPVPYSCGDK